MRRRRESEDWLAHSCATQIQLAEKREQVISVEKVDKDIRAIVREIRRRFGALAPLIAAEVVGDTDLAVSQVKIDRALKGALEALSQFDPDDESVRDVLISTKTNSSH